jgi:DNA-binding NarL/FixJ family response regulator
VEATRHLKAELLSVQVIGLSMHAESDMAQAMRDAGAVAYLTKGGPSGELIEIIRSCRTQ